MAMRIPYALARQIADHAQADTPNEACGLLAGDCREIARAIPLSNAASATGDRFRIDPEEQLAALKAIDADGLEWIGAYHSHPRSAPIPSRADIEAAQDAKLLHLIVSLERAKPRLKLWRIDGDSVTPVELVFEGEMGAERGSPLSLRHRLAILIAGIASLLLLVAISVSLLPPPPELTPVP